MDSQDHGAAKPRLPQGSAGPRAMAPASALPDVGHETVARLLAQVEQDMLAVMTASLPGSVLPDMAAQVLASGGKRMRARLALTAALALGVDETSARAWAAACELMHNATLVHDDVQDGDTQRRNAPTLWVRYGVPQAINVGDWLFMLAQRILARLPAAVAAQHGFALTQALSAGLATVVEGQALECASAQWRGREEDFPYEIMVRGKTAALFALPIEGALLLSGHDEAAIGWQVAPFAEVGVLFQMQDDVLDLWGAKGRGVVGADLYEKKLSAVVTTHLRRCPEDKPWLGAFLQQTRQQTAREEVMQIIATFAAKGTQKALLQDMQRRSDALAQAVSPPLAAVMHALLRQVWAPIASLAAQVLA